MDNEIYKFNLHKKSHCGTFENARRFRKNETQVEEILWKRLRNGQLNDKKFRRQHPMAGFILDFYCHECKLAIELDGTIHQKENQRLYDEEREQVLVEAGITILRFENSEVINNLEGVIEEIKKRLT
jgi:very-short-patch-repair endonuclease